MAPLSDTTFECGVVCQFEGGVARFNHDTLHHSNTWLDTRFPGPRAVEPLGRRRDCIRLRPRNDSKVPPLMLRTDTVHDRLPTEARLQPAMSASSIKVRSGHVDYR